MKTEELNALKEEVETLNKKLHELTEEELAQVPGGCTTYPGGPGEQPLLPNQCPTCGRILVGGHCARCGY